MRFIPTLAIVVAIYNILVFVYPEALVKVLFNLNMPSGDVTAFSVQILLLSLGAFLLFVEILKATRTSNASILDHGLSLVLFVICLLEFLLVPGMGSATFLLITLFTLLDVVAGFTITLSSARRDFTMGG